MHLNLEIHEHIFVRNFLSVFIFHQSSFFDRKEVILNKTKNQKKKYFRHQFMKQK
eukprot:GDKH01020010.1.p1 GENE.GDKH01020010.1~~GDKH01020010.1.p1  ORF type:complete len:55 (+),score=3.79 GDKH01020010.1:3-167(+)